MIGSIFFMAIVNLGAFYFFYNTYLTLYLWETIQKRESITQEYIDEVIKEQILAEMESIFDNVEIKYFELMDQHSWEIPLNNKENIDTIVNYLIQAGVHPKRIEELIPQNYLQNILTDLQNPETPEYIFFHNLIRSMILTNSIAILILFVVFYIFSRSIFLPIRRLTKRIRHLKIGKDFRMIPYSSRDEIWLLVHAINGLNIKLNIGENTRSKLLADISHELKTPITAIQCYIEGIKDGVIPLDNRTINSILTEMERLVKMVNSIMEFENFNQKPLKLDIQNQDIVFITQGIIHQFRQKLKATNQKIVTVGKSFLLKTDKNYYTQIVQNILSNFIKYAGQNTKLTITFTPHEIRFEDNGIGVSKQELPYIKEKFYQGSNAKIGSADERGIGVWLSVIDKIVRDLWWSLEIDSHVGKGFTITIFTQSPR